MLMQVIDDSKEHRFMADRRNGYHLVFASKTAVSGSQPFHAHWVGTCGNEESLEAMIRWAAVRRDKWQVWGELAERIGQSAFAKHMRDMVTAEPLEEVMAATVTILDDPCEIAIGQMLSGPARMRTEVLYIHRFGSAALRDRFYEWFYADRNYELSATFVHLAFNHGTDELGKVIDQITASAGLVRPAKRAKRRERAVA